MVNCGRWREQFRSNLGSGNDLDGFLKQYFKARFPFPPFSFANSNHQLLKAVRKKKHLLCLALNIGRNMTQ